MTTPATQENKTKSNAEKEAAELQDRIVNLREQERQVQRESAQRREQEALAAYQKQREQADRDRREQAEALHTIGRQAREGIRQLEDGTRAVARGTALSATTLLPPAVIQPSLLIDATFNIAIAMLTFQRDFLKDLLSTGRQADVG
ncbi:MAG: hypothetical protein ACR2K2_00595 [Mycobacteriales bacterium]